MVGRKDGTERTGWIGDGKKGDVEVRRMNEMAKKGKEGAGGQRN